MLGRGHKNAYHSFRGVESWSGEIIVAVKGTLDSGCVPWGRYSQLTSLTRGHIFIIISMHGSLMHWSEACISRRVADLCSRAFHIT